MKLCEYIDCCLTKLGVEKIFGIPGSLVMPIWQNLNDKEIILCSHEQEASYVATGYAKMSKKPVCVITTGGPGVTNCVSGIVAANIDSIPLIYISGRTPVSRKGYGERQEESSINRLYDSIVILNGVTKKSVCIDDISNAPDIIWNVMRKAIEARQGAVHISIPVDLQNQELTYKISNFETQTVTYHATSLDIAKRPIFIMGWGAWMSESYKKIYELAEKVKAPVLVTSKAYCCINANNKMYLGKLGYGYNSVIDDFIKEYNPNMILAFGSSLGSKDIKNTAVEHLLNEIPTFLIADDCSYISHRNSNIVGCEVPNMTNFVNNLLESTGNRDEDIELYEKILEARVRAIDYWSDKIIISDIMARCIQLIGDLCDEKCVVSADAGNNLANASVLINPTSPGHMFIDVGLRAMGTGICTAVGMAIADNKNKYVSITGDGCMLMNGNVMHVASELRLPIVFIVFNNQSLGRVRVGQSIMNDYRATDIKNVDYVTYAKTFGLITYKCFDMLEFEKAFIECLADSKPALIEVITDNDEIPVTVKDNIY